MRGGAEAGGRYAGTCSAIGVTAMEPPPHMQPSPPLRIAGIRGRAWAVFVLLFLLFGNGPPLRAQDPPVELRDYTHDSWLPP